jgi:peptidoglycan hydrolase CwlO-like protein
MWRNAEFRSEHDRVSKLVNKYKNKQADYDLETSKLSKKDQEIAELKQRIISLEQELDHERERLAYAALIARQNNIDPNLFEKETPIIFRSN